MTQEFNNYARYYENLYASRKRDISKEEFRSLIKKAQEGDKDAKDVCIENNLRLAIKYASDIKYTNICEKEDLIQQAVLGLEKAIMNYDVESKNEFSTYAHKWILGSITRYITNCGFTIKVAPDVVKKMTKMRKLANECGTTDESKLMAYAIKKGIVENESEYYEIKLFMDQKNIMSLDEPIKNTEDGKVEFLGDTIESDEQASVEELAINSQLIEEMIKNMHNLNEIETEIIEKHYGLNGHKAQSFAEIGTQMHYTKQNVSRIHNIAVKKMRKMIKL